MDEAVQKWTSAESATTGRRAVLGGMAALGVAGIFGTSRALGQDTATPSAAEETDVGSAGETDTTDDAYQIFLAALAANLGLGDPAAVDTGIREALKTVIDERLAAGEIAANDAEAIKAEIDASASPLRIGKFGGRGGHGRGGSPKDAGADDSVTPEATATIG
jgi:hypothetical protein